MSKNKYKRTKFSNSKITDKCMQRLFDEDPTYAPFMKKEDRIETEKKNIQKYLEDSNKKFGYSLAELQSVFSRLKTTLQEYKRWTFLNDVINKVDYENLGDYYDEFYYYVPKIKESEYKKINIDDNLVISYLTRRLGWSIHLEIIEDALKKLREQESQTYI